jgi:hypothetical protein
VVQSAKAIRELGLPQTPPKQAFADAVDWFRERVCETLTAGCEKFHKVYGTRQIAHSGTGRSERKNVQGVLLADDRPSRPGVQRPLRRKSNRNSSNCFTRSSSFIFHLVRVGRDGRRHPQSRRQKGPELHVRRVLGQMVRRVEKCGKQAEALQVEWGSPIRAEAWTKNWPPASSTP